MENDKLLAFIKELVDHLKDGLDKEDLEWVAGELVKFAEGFLPGATGQEKEDWVVGKLKEVIEQAKKETIAVVEEWDHRIPIIGWILDLPFVDDLEARAIGYAYDLALKQLIERVHLLLAVQGEVHSSAIQG